MKASDPMLAEIQRQQPARDEAIRSGRVRIHRSPCACEGCTGRPLLAQLTDRLEAISARQHALARERAIVEGALRRLRIGEDERVVAVALESELARW